MWYRKGCSDSRVSAASLSRPGAATGVRATYSRRKSSSLGSAVVGDRRAGGGGFLTAGLLAETGQVHAAELLLEIGDLVAQPGSQLELQLAGRCHHLAGELLNQISELSARH
jgi:hypothetical protein